MATFTLTGTILDFNNKPIQGAVMRIIPSVTATSGPSVDETYLTEAAARTNSRGKFSAELVTVPNLSYQVQGTGEAKNYLSVRFEAYPAGTVVDIADVLAAPPFVPTSGYPVPPGGTTGQALIKLSNANGNTGWGPGGGSSNYVDVKTHGALGNGVADDTLAIEAAITAAIAQGGAVWVPKGTYLISKLPGKDHMIEARPGLVIDGYGTLKVKNAAGDYSAVIKGATWGTDLTNFQLRNVTIDHNSTNNAVTNVATLLTEANFRAGIMAVGENITVRGVTFKDIDAINTVILNGTAVKNARVQDCSFIGVGGNSPAQHDHSTIYTESKGAVITGNYFKGTPGGLGCITAIETHGYATVVADNRIEDYYIGMNITGVSSHGNHGIVVTNNVIHDVNIGMQLWSHVYAGQPGIRQMMIANNSIVINHDKWHTVYDQATPTGILMDPTSDSDVTNLTIAHNNITFKPWTAAAEPQELAGAGINLWIVSTTVKLKDSLITGNIVTGAMSAGLRLQWNTERVIISENIFTDPGSSTATSPNMFDDYRCGIIAAGDHVDLQILNNKTFDTRTPHKITGGVRTFFGSLSRGLRAGNTVACTDNTVLPDYTAVSGSALPTKPLDAETASAITSGALTQAAGDARWAVKTAPLAVKSSAAINNDFGVNIFSVTRSDNESANPSVTVFSVNGAGQVRAGSNISTFGAILAESTGGLISYGGAAIEVITGSHMQLYAKTVNDQVKVFRGMLGLPHYATAGLPSAVSNPGALVFDNTVNKVMFSNGSVWGEPGGASDAEVASRITGGSATQAAGDARWQRSLKILNVMDYGATGNGSADDTAAIQAAMDAVPSSGAVVYFPQGTYLCRLVRPKSNTLIRGSKGAMLLYRSTGAASYDSILAFGDQSSVGSSSTTTNLRNIQIEGLTFRGTGDALGLNENQAMVHLSGVSDITIKDCFFLGMQGDGVYIGATSTANTERHNERITITNCVFDGLNNFGRQGVSIIEGTDVIVENSRFQNLAAATMPGAIDIETNPLNTWALIRNIYVRGNTFRNIGGNVAHVSFAMPAVTMTSPVFNVVFEGNHHYSSGRPYFVGGPNGVGLSTEPTSVMIRNNYARCTSGNSQAVQVQKVRGVSINDNTFVAFTLSPFLLSQDVVDIEIQGNTLIECGTASFTGVECIGTVVGLDVSRNRIVTNVGHVMDQLILISNASVTKIRCVDNFTQGVTSLGAKIGTGSTNPAENYASGNYGPTVPATIFTGFLTELHEVIDDRSDALIIPGSSLSKVYDDTAGTLTLDVTQAAWNAAYAEAAKSAWVPDTARVTQGLYTRTRPTPDAGPSNITPLAMDAVTPTRMWSQGWAFAQLGYGPADGSTFTPIGSYGSVPGGVGFPGINFSATHMWLTVGPMSPNQGSVWRSPRPNATITGSFDHGLTFTKKFDIAAPPSGITPGVNSFFRNSSIAFDTTGAKVMLLEYGTTVVGGPSVYYSTDSGDNWTLVKTFTNAKHGHAVKFINGRFWVMLGDAGFSDLGLWSCDPASPTLWTRRSIYGAELGGNYLYGINFFPFTFDGKEVIVTEADTMHSYGPIFFPTAAASAPLQAFMPMTQHPPQFAGTMRSLTYDATTGNLYWYQTTEVGSFGPNDSIWMSAPPYRNQVKLDSFAYASSVETQGDPVQSGNYIWFGANRITKEKYYGQ